MNKVGFFTAITYNTPSPSRESLLLERVDNYFSLFGKKAYVIEHEGQHKAILSDSTSSFTVKCIKILSYFILIFPLLMLFAKIVLRSRNHFELLNPQEELEKGLEIPTTAMIKIATLISKIASREGCEGIDLISPGANNIVFKLPERPNIVFKISLNQSIETRFKNMIKAKEICLTHHLNLLVIPQAKKFTVKSHNQSYTLIAETCLNFSHREEVQEKLYQEHPNTLNSTVRQLATFVAKSGFYDVTWRNIPILEEQDNLVGLIDLEEMGNPQEGFSGAFKKNGSCGLIRCVSEEQIDLVIKEGVKQGVITETGREIQEAKQKRLLKLRHDENLRAFHQHNRITTGLELLPKDAAHIGLTNIETPSLIAIYEPCRMPYSKNISLKTAAEEVVTEINRRIQSNPNERNKKERRSITLPIENGIFQAYYNHTWLEAILRALMQNGHIFSFKRTATDFHIQA